MLVGRTALVTGSTSGIGLGIAKVLAKNGANLIINGFGDSREIENLRESLAKEHKVNVMFHGADLSKLNEIESMITNNKIDILINNAGIQHTNRVENFPVEQWNKIINVNLSAVFHTTRLALPYMQSKNWGRIINIASVHGLVASVNKSAYVAAKHGVLGLTKVTALENARSGVTCNAICPGWVLTPLVQKQIDDKAKELNISSAEAKILLVGEKQPSHDFVKPSQLGDLAVFLCSEGGNEVRGVAWNIDGGWVCQ